MSKTPTNCTEKLIPPDRPEFMLSSHAIIKILELLVLAQFMFTCLHVYLFLGSFGYF